jgi:hypothetical protein
LRVNKIWQDTEDSADADSLLHQFFNLLKTGDLILALPVPLYVVKFLVDRGTQLLGDSGMSG